jgi:hypothetical protein
MVIAHTSGAAPNERDRKYESAVREKKTQWLLIGRNNSPKELGDVTLFLRARGMAHATVHLKGHWGFGLLQQGSHN